MNPAAMRDVQQHTWLGVSHTNNTSHHLKQVVPGDESAIRGKSQGGGCCIKKTNTAMIIGIYESPVQPGDVNVLVENLGDYLAGQSY